LLLRLFFLLALVVLALAAFIALRHFGVAVAFVVIFTYLSVLIIVMAIILNHPRLPRQDLVNDFADELEAQGLLVLTSFRADRAFRVDEFSQEGPHYFLELDAGGVLHLSGRYLYDYEPVKGLPRRFPCTQFTLRRHAEVGYVVDLICGGIVIEPEVEAPPYSAQDFDLYRVPADGVILDDLTFDQLRLQRTTPTSFPS
jgi:hypothetical protein